MKRRQWDINRGADHDPELWHAKLGEEFGEVARANVDRLRANSIEEYKTAHQAMIEELEHVEFIARNYRAYMQKRYEEGWA
jgi:serine/threonine protein kinase HipA of HipAB toxin-antitoxin module